MEFPKDLRYTKSHEWMRQDGAIAFVGITEHAQKELSDVVYVDLPEVGKVVNKGDVVCVVESVKAAFDIYAPVSGAIVEVNSDLGSDPALINSDPYGKGWMFKVELTHEDECAELMESTAYEQHVSSGGH